MTKAERPHLLLTNDDGIAAPGLSALADILAPHYDTLIVAPDRERSATGHAITVLRDLRLERCDRNGKHWGWSFEGRPADCVKVAVTVVSKDRPFDLVVAGINMGQNLGLNVLYSGTVAAAREGVMLGIPAIAFSVSYSDPSDVRFDTAAKVALNLIRKVLKRGLPKDVLLNVNVPSIDFEDIQGHAVTRQGNSYYGDKFEHVEGRIEETSVVRNVGERFTASTLDDTDLDDRAVRNNQVSITPLHIDSTAHRHLSDLEDLIEPY